MGTRMQAAILPESTVGLRVRKSTVFKSTVVLVPIESDEEAHYLTAALNCSWANWFLRTCNVRGRQVSLCDKRSGNDRDSHLQRAKPVARELARLGQQAAESARRGDANSLAHIEVLIDEAAARLWDIGRRNQEAIHSSLAALG
jgi:hypothetical protein